MRLNQEEDKRKEEKILRETKDTHEEKLRLFAIVREWNSEEIYSCRQKAGKLIRENPSKTLKELHDDFDVDYTCLAVVMGFFTNLNMCIDREIITVENVIDEFGRIFVWWDEVAVKGKFPKDDPQQLLIVIRSKEGGFASQLILEFGIRKGRLW